MQDLIMNNKSQLPSALLKKICPRMNQITTAGRWKQASISYAETSFFSLKWIEHIPAYFSVLIMWQ